MTDVSPIPTLVFASSMCKATFRQPDRRNPDPFRHHGQLLGPLLAQYLSRRLKLAGIGAPHPFGEIARQVLLLWEHSLKVSEAIANTAWINLE
jgi:hypothetical protein